MPELPEVETTIRGLRSKLSNKAFVDVWTDWAKIVKKPKNFEQFKRDLAGKRIRLLRRRGKNIIFELSGNKIILVHQKMTGHLLYGKWLRSGNKWIAPKGPLSDKMNSFLHLVFTLSDNSMLALSDLRKFAKVELWDKEDFEKNSEINNLGPEPLEKSFGFRRFKDIISKEKRKIKQVLMDQEVIAGIGNIYSDEILFNALVCPLKAANELSEKELKAIYLAARKILPKAIKLGGESISDYRKPNGEKGEFDIMRKVYRKEGEECPRCGTEIVRKKIGGRSAHYCPNCQKL